MNKDNIKAPYSILEDKQLKLFDFFEEFSEYEFLKDEIILIKKKIISCNI